MAPAGAGAAIPDGAGAAIPDGAGAAIPDGAGATIIEVSGLVKRYGDAVAVAGLDFTVRQGTIAALLGGNGAGKTTTLALLLGLVVPSAGSIRILGEDMLRHRYRVLPRINFSSPYIDLPHRLTVRQNLAIYGRLYGVADVAARIETLARDLQVGAFLDRQVGKLSRASAPASRWRRRSSTSPCSCCSTSRPPRSIPIPPIGCGHISKPIARAPGRRSCSPRTTWARSSASRTRR